MSRGDDRFGAVLPFEDRRAGGEKSCEFLSGPLSGAGAAAGPLDPYRAHEEFPLRWRAYLLAHFGYEPELVARVFHVSQRAARKWLDGETGCKGASVAIALSLHPDSAPQMLIAMAAE